MIPTWTSSSAIRSKLKLEASWAKFARSDFNDSLWSTHCRHRPSAKAKFTGAITGTARPVATGEHSRAAHLKFFVPRKICSKHIIKTRNFLLRNVFAPPPNLNTWLRAWLHLWHRQSWPAFAVIVLGLVTDEELLVTNRFVLSLFLWLFRCLREHSCRLRLHHRAERALSTSSNNRWSRQRGFTLKRPVKSQRHKQLRANY